MFIADGDDKLKSAPPGSGQYVTYHSIRPVARQLVQSTVITPGRQSPAGVAYIEIRALILFFI